MRLIGTRNPRKRASFAEAAQGRAPGEGGLPIPDPLPCFRDVPRLLEMDFLERSAEILHRMLGDEYDREELEEVVRASFDIPMPLRAMGHRIVALELFHGPTLAFQDFGCRFHANLLARKGNAPRTVLVATTGNAGAAVAHAFRGQAGCRTAVLLPADRVSSCQGRQIAALGARIFAVEGPYAACRALADQCFADPDLALVSADSANIGRIVGLVPLFFEAVARVQVLALKEPPVLALPCGDLGLLCAGLLAKGMGLPVKAFVAATPADATLCPDLAVGSPANEERLQALLRNKPSFRALLRPGSRSDEGILAAAREMRAAGCVPDPATALAHGVLREHLGPVEAGILLATAHPAKSAGFLRQHLDLELPEALAGLPEAPAPTRLRPGDVEALEHELQH